MLKKLLISSIKFYQVKISPKKKYPLCKYFPTCSSYAIESINRFGCLKGLFFALYRILRCNPLSKGGYDPVP